jgi:hypothetical protein
MTPDPQRVRSRTLRPWDTRPARYWPSGQVLTVPPRSLVVLAGLPGAGKTTLLRRLDAPGVPDVRALDSEEVADRLRLLARHVPYRVLRPAVHALHLLRVLREVRTPVSCVLTTDPMTSPLRRSLLRLVARSRGRSLAVVLVDATAQQARTGQHARGRTLGPRRMAQHVSRADRLRDRLERTGGISCVDEVLVLPRAVARTTDGPVVAAGLSLQQPRACAA